MMDMVKIKVCLFDRDTMLYQMSMAMYISLRCYDALGFLGSKVLLFLAK